MINPIDFIYTHWHTGTTGLVIVAVVIVAAVVIAVAREIHREDK